MEINGYKVFCFQEEDEKSFLVLDAIVPIDTKLQVNLQGFTLNPGWGINHGCYPFPLLFEKGFPEEGILEQALTDGANHVKGIEGWGDAVEAKLDDLVSEFGFLDFVEKACKSKKLSEDIAELKKKRIENSKK